MNIRVALHGMDKRCEDRMKILFSMNFKNQCECTDIESADTVILDMDDKNVASTWTEFRLQYPDIPVIVMAEKPISLVGTIYVSKPAKISELLHALQTTSNKEMSLNISKPKDTGKVASAMEERYQHKSNNKENDNFELYYNPDNFLQGRLLNAIKESKRINKDTFIKCWNNHWIIISPSSDYLVQNVADNQVKTLGLVQIGDDENNMAYSEHRFSSNEISHMVNTPVRNVRVVPREQFIWNITVKTARGRIPTGTSLDEPYVLLHWPNLPQLAHIPSIARISAFWVDNPQSINNVVRHLNIPQEHVLSFFSAATAIKIMKPAQRREDKLIEPEVVSVDRKKRGIFSALFEKISGNIKTKQVEEDGQEVEHV